MKRKTVFIALYCAFMLIIPVSCGQQNIKGVQSSMVGTDQVKMIKITSGEANVRSGCDADAPVLQSAGKNTRLDVVGILENWYAVKLPNNKIGFVPQSEGTPVVSGQQKQPGGQNAGGQGTGQGAGGQGAANPGAGGTGAGGGGNAQSKIPDTTTNNKNSMTAEEQEMFRLVNEARAQNGVAALKADMELTNVARIKSQDMIDNNYFSHNSPTYGSPFDMMKNFSIEYVKAGENLAGNQTVQKAHEALMNSPGHRKNILSPDYTHIGIGIKKGGTYGSMFTQEFISKPQ